MENTHRPFNTSHLARDIGFNLPFSFTKVHLEAGAAILPSPLPAPLLIAYARPDQGIHQVVANAERGETA